MGINRTQETNLKKVLDNWDKESHFLNVEHMIDTPSINQTQHLDLIFMVVDSEDLFDFVIDKIDEDEFLFHDIFYKDDTIDESNLKYAIESYGEDNSLEYAGLDFQFFSDVY
ncbi:hypothetical protein DY102_07250 [Apilactobacillus timberlakei]|uniref:hypothetical protein n=1 Tax=Apilactobacillus timberlakei TaxID=2008380 RepID=UPI001128DA41|nr:hypothetical protein [Apilactobacillus timberlakei]TPR21480.1 hypothetical protein DY102_07250 [Apilactobacillus timberlakei]